VANNLSGTAGMVTLLQSPTSLISNPSITQTPYPGSEYQDIGIKIKATPSLHPNNEVTLQLELEIKALSGSSVNGIPIISNRSLTQMIRLKEDETSILGGLLDKQETKAITGLPGFAQIPAAGYLFGRRDNSLTDNELLILITPRRVRLPLRQSGIIYAGRGEPSGRTGGGAAAPIAPQPEPEPAPVQPTGEPGQPAPPSTPNPPPPQPNPPLPPPDQPNPQGQPPPPQPTPQQ
jgi:general secretion pathway protein D